MPAPTFPILPQGEHARPVLGKAHAVEGDHGPRVRIAVGSRLDFFALQPRAAFDLGPLEPAHGGFECAIAVSVLGDEIDVEHPLALMQRFRLVVGRNERLAQADNRRKIADRDRADDTAC